MVGTLAQLMALVAHGNAYLAGWDERTTFIRTIPYFGSAMTWSLSGARGVFD
jgi:hypothetical protein